MKRLLKYLLLFVVSAAFYGCVGNPVYPASAEEFPATASFDSEYHSVFSPTDSRLSLPRQKSFASQQRVQSIGRRSNSTVRNCTEFAKSGKVINVELRYFVHLQLFIINSSHIEPSHRLLCLRKLII